MLGTRERMQTSERRITARCFFRDPNEIARDQQDVCVIYACTRARARSWYNRRQTGSDSLQDQSTVASRRYLSTAARRKHLFRTGEEEKRRRRCEWRYDIGNKITTVRWTAPGLFSRLPGCFNSCFFLPSLPSLCSPQPPVSLVLFVLRSSSLK